ncbi:unnamed protein product [Urochloa humidicola]
MLELKLKKESRFLNVLEAILDLVDVASVDCFSTGLKLQAVDTEQVAMISLLFPANEFQHYICNEKLSMGIPINEMVKAIRSSDKDDNITIKVCDANFNTITLSFGSPKGNVTTAYDLCLVDAETPCFKIPDWQALESKYQAFVKMPSAEFVRVCKYLNSIGNDGYISVTEKRLKFFALGKSGRLNIKYKKSQFVTVRAPVSVTLDPKYLNSFANVSTLFDQVKICLSTTKPLMVECKFGDIGYIRYFQAPKAKPEMEEEEIKGSGEEGMEQRSEGIIKEGQGDEGRKRIRGSKND